MINSFGSKETEKIWNGDRVKNLPQEIQQIGSVGFPKVGPVKIRV